MCDVCVGREDGSKYIPPRAYNSITSAATYIILPYILDPSETQLECTSVQSSCLSVCVSWCVCELVCVLLKMFEVCGHV